MTAREHDPVAAPAVGALAGSHCTTCGEVHHPQLRLCPCGAVPEPVSLDGNGTVVAHSTVRKGARAAPVPYEVVQVALDAGPVIYGRWSGPIAPAAGARARRHPAPHVAFGASVPSGGGGA